MEAESNISEQSLNAEEMIAQIDRIGKVSALTCPECHGALWEINDPDLLRFRCHVGHAYSIGSLASGQEQMLENALWSALRALEEKLLLLRRSVERARSGNFKIALKALEVRADAVEKQADVIRQVLLSGGNSDIADETALITEP